MRSPSACLGLACLSLALGCTAKHPPKDESKPEIVIPIGTLVVLGDDATVYLEPDATTGVRLPKPPDAGPRSYAVEVIAVTKTRLEVQTLGPEHPPTCAGNFEFADDYLLHFWIERAALRPVLVAPQSFVFSDGTKLELQPGVPVIDDASGELSIGSQSMFVPLAGTRLGLSHELPAPVEREGPGRSVQDGTVLRYAEGRHITAVEPFERASEVLESSTEGEQLLVFDNACGRFTLRAPANALFDFYAMKGPKNAIPRMARSFDPEMAQSGILGVMGNPDDHFRASPYGGAFNVEPQNVECTAPRWTVASGVALSWADSGRPAGTVRRAHELPEDARQIGARVCFALHDGLELCADASKLGRTVDENCPSPP